MALIGLVIDLRNNPGGLVNEAINIAEAIVPKGKELLITRDKNEKETITKSKKDNYVDVPVIVLVNQYSASASEILAGALKDNNSAQIIGVKTYGKGVIQQVFTLPDGSVVKITTEEYVTPARNKIHKVGISPDISIDFEDNSVYTSKMLEEDDVQLQKAIEVLRGI